MNSDPRKSSRRDFLKGKSAVDSLGDTLAGGDETGGLSAANYPVRSAHPDFLMQVTRRAMACEFQVLFHGHDQGEAVDAALAGLDRVDQLENQLSVYRDDSEVSRINRRAADGPCPIDDSLLRLISRCNDLCELTGGAFDITAAPLVKLWGFHVRQGRLPSDAEIQETLGHIGSRLLELNEEQQTIFFRRSGVELNFGSVGKGLALDLCSSELDATGIGSYLAHGGQSSIIARGSRNRNDGDDDGWWIALRHPLRPEQVLAEIRLYNRALGTSGSGRQFFYHRGTRYGHVLDPRTGRPGEGVLSVTVLSPRAEEADALATAFFVMGPEAAGEYCQKHPDLSAVFAVPDKRGGAVGLESIQMGEDLRIPDEGKSRENN